MAERGSIVRRNGPGHGGAARGYSWSPFEKGNEAALRHGSYATLKLAPRAAEIADELREIVPCWSIADEPAIRLLALTLARVERATAALDRLDEIADGSASALAAYTSGEAEKFARLRQDALGWINAARRLANDLGLTPTSRAKLGLDVARAEHEVRLLDLYRDGGEAA